MYGRVMFKIYKYLIFTKIYSRMLKTRRIKVKSTKIEEILMITTIIKVIKVVLTVVIMVIIKNCNHIKL